MSAFTQFTSIQPLPKSNTWITTQPLVYFVGGELSQEHIIVPVGYEFDGASVPMVFGWFIQRVEPNVISASALHDHLYTEGRRYDRSKTDCIFLESLLTTNSKFKSIMMYLGVRLGGWLYWNKLI